MFLTTFVLKLKYSFTAGQTDTYLSSLIEIEWAIKSKETEENKMKYIIRLILTIFVSISFLTFDSYAQRGMGWKGGRGLGPGGPCCRMYNPEEAETISGEVVSVDKIIHRKGMSYGVHLTVKTDKETIPVHLGPGWYIENQDTKFEPKDKVEIKGSRIVFNGKPALIAYEVKKGEEILELRDGNGFPAWRG